jgi:hypothetical protein
MAALVTADQLDVETVAFQAISSVEAASGR